MERREEGNLGGGQVVVMTIFFTYTLHIVFIWEEMHCCIIYNKVEHRKIAAF